MLMGAAITLRPTYALFPFSLALVIFWQLRRRAIEPILVLSLGTAAVLIAAIVPYLFVTGGLRELYLATIRYNLDVYATSAYASSLSVLTHHRAEILCDLVLVAWAAWALFHGRTKRKVPTVSYSDSTKASILLFLLYYISARVSIIVMGKYFMQHYAMLLALTAFLTADILERLSLLLPIKLARLIPLFVVLSICSIFHLSSYMPFFVEGMLRGETDPIEYAYRRDPHEPADKFLRAEVVVNYLKSKHVEGGRIECWGMSPWIYWRTHTASASRFTKMEPLVMKMPNGGYAPYQLRWRAEFVDSIANVYPSFVILPYDSNTSFWSLQLAHNLPGFDSILQSKYVHDTDLAGWLLYRRRN